MAQVSVKGLWTIIDFEKHSLLQHTTETYQHKKITNKV